MRGVWTTFVKRAGAYQTKILLSFVYLVAVGLSAIVARVIRTRLLALDPSHRPSYWRQRRPTPRGIDELERQF